MNESTAFGRLVAAACVALLLTACTGDERPGAAGPTTTPTTAAEPVRGPGFDEMPTVPPTVPRSTVPVPEGVGLDGYVLLTTCPSESTSGCDRPMEPAPTATVVAKLDNGTDAGTVKTDAAGYFLLALPQGAYQLQVTVDGVTARCLKVEETVYDTYVRVEVVCPVVA